MNPQFHPYRPRPIRFVELMESDGWRVKIYGISARAEMPSGALIDAAKDAARSRLPSPPQADDRYGVAFVVAHEGREANFVLVDWWFGENMLQHHVYASPLEAPRQLSYISPTGVGACVWELAVLAFERRAWIDAVLSNPESPRIDAYCDSRMNALV